MTQQIGSFNNFTSLPDSEAIKKLERLRTLVLQGEQNRVDRLEIDERNVEIWNNEIYDDAQKEFFSKLDMTPFEFPVQRPLLNTIISMQRNQDITFEFVPTDAESYKRHQLGKQQFVETQYLNNPDSQFSTKEEAEEFYDKYSDDEYSKAVTIYLHNLRNLNNAKYIESECFQRGLISGLDFLKAYVGNKYNPEGDVVIERKPQRAMIYDYSSVQYDLSDIEYIGEVHLLYKSQIAAIYPQWKDQIYKIFEEFTNLDQSLRATYIRDWSQFYSFDRSSVVEPKAKVAEVWFLDTEERLQVTDLTTNDTRIADYGLTEQQIWDLLLQKETLEIKDNTDPQDLANMVRNKTLRSTIIEQVKKKYQISQTYQKIWYKAVFTFNTLFEFERSPLPTGSHPYYPFFAQFTEGEFRSIMADIKDIIIGINKGLAFRELIMAHSSKGLLIVDEDAMVKSQYTPDDIADLWTSIGGVMIMKPRANQSIKDIVLPITTVGEGLNAINSVLQDLDNRLFQITGVNMAQLGITQRETTSSGLRQQIAAGEGNNGLIFDNFFRTLEGFYKSKVIPLIVWIMKHKQSMVMRNLSDEYKPWIAFDIDQDFNVFERTVRDGSYNFTVRPIQDNAEVQEQRDAKLMELAMGGLIPIEVAIEFSTNPDRYKILQRIKQVEMNKMKEATFEQFDSNTLVQAAQQSGLGYEQTQELIEKARQAKQKAQESQQSGQQIQGSQGAPTIRKQAAEPARLERVQNPST